MNKILGLAILSIMLFATTGFALGDCSHGLMANYTINETDNSTIKSCIPIVCNDGLVYNSEIDNCIKQNIIKNDCPAPSLTTGIAMITYAPKDSSRNPIFTKGKDYMFATYWKERWNTKVFITAEELEKEFVSHGFKKVSYRQTANGWAFSKWKYIG